VCRLYDLTIQIFGRLDILINNAAIGGPSGDVTSFDLSAWQQTLNVNLTGPFLCAKYAIPLLREAGGTSSHDFPYTGGSHRWPIAAPLARRHHPMTRSVSRVKSGSCVLPSSRRRRGR
jgi:NAD(P)-dependent dehydrogenase (short-subunit alcohol dehydrogenase family)